jgi:conjugative relaxase-like TrwC/TraI family protein
MLTISKPLSAAQAQEYHRAEFSNAQSNYYSEGDHIQGEWHGKLAEQWGLRGAVEEEQFSRLSEGQHPITGEQLVGHRPSHEYENQHGDIVKTMEHRAGWDATFSAPKSVSLTALVGGDDDIRQAHRESVRVALDELEKYTQARMGGNYPAETTGKWVAACFEHDSARPVDGYAAPQLHTHVVFFNVTETAKGETHSVQPHELYRSQQYATAVYRSELADRLKTLGYETEQGKSCQPEIKGYTRDYLEASSPRSQQIKDHLEQHGVSGAAAAQIAAHQTRDTKTSSLTHDEMQDRHRDLAARFGNQPEQVVKEAQSRKVEEQRPDEKQQRIESALTYSRDKNFERQAVADERDLMRDSLRHSMGYATFKDVHERFEDRVSSRELIERENRSPGRAFTTDKMIGYERDTIEMMRAGKQHHEMLANSDTRHEIQEKHDHLSVGQRTAVDQILSSQDKITALEGPAGAGKTTALAAIREGAEREGYEVRGLAPTSRAAHKLEESGIQSGTLQRHLIEDEQGDQKRLYVMDESSLASTKQMNEFLHKLGDEDRVLLVGDKHQHEAVEAGKPYQQLQEAGMQTARLDEIVRQKDPALKEAVEQLSRGQVFEAVENLERQGRVHEVVNREERFTEIAREYASEPKGTLVVSPDNESRHELNSLIHHEMQERGSVSHDEHKLQVFDARQEMTGADRQWAAQYEAGDIVRYTHGSRVLGVEQGEYARVEKVDAKDNHITVERENGGHLTYDPHRLSGVAVYQEHERAFSEGDRVQFTAPSKELHVANRELGTIDKINDAGDLKIHMDSGREIEFNIREHPHLDHGYAVTSHSSQGQTADRVLVHVDTDRGEQLVNNRFAYVSVSRGQYDAQIYTNDRSELARDLSRELLRPTATDAHQEKDGAEQMESSSAKGTSREHENEHAQEQAQSIGHGVA